MHAFSSTFLLVYAALFPIVNPIGSAPFFLARTASLTDERRSWLAARIAINSFFLLMGSVFVGSHVLEFFGVSLPALRVAGGLVVSIFGWRMLNSAISPDTRQAAAASGTTSDTITDTFYPLTMPLTVGPGSISVAVTLGSQRPEADWSHLFLLGGATVAGLLAIVVTVYLAYRFSSRVSQALGQGATSVAVRLSAFILLCIGIQIMWGGIDGFLALLRR
jgi:multiple antibiotic resistance protein